MTKQQAASYIDHTNLHPEATSSDISRLCQEAKDNKFYSVCINGTYVSLAHKELSGSSVKICAVVGFPLGAMTTKMKAAEAAEATALGAQEIDMVAPIGYVKAGDWDYVLADIKAVAKESRSLKVIFECCLLSDEEIVKLCEICQKAGAHFVKTSTGFSKGGATEHDVALMKAHIASNMEVKAAGGIRTLEDFQKMVSAGATRIGASAGMKILSEMEG